MNHDLYAISVNTSDNSSDRLAPESAANEADSLYPEEMRHFSQIMTRSLARAFMVYFVMIGISEIAPKAFAFLSLFGSGS